MPYSFCRAIWRLSRAEGSVLAFFLIMAPYYQDVGNFKHSVFLALPILPMAMCTFILNDINDMERDVINHPDRPLPSGSLSISVAAAVYMVLFILSLVLVRTLIGENVQYVYLLGFIMAINYNTVVNHLPLLKNPYVALACLIPFGIVNSATHQHTVPTSFIVGVFFYILGREMLMDIRDSEGDGKTLIKSVPIATAAMIAFFFQVIGITAIVMETATTLQYLAAVAIMLIFVVAAVMWRRRAQRRKAIHLMKLQMLFALLFLI